MVKYEKHVIQVALQKTALTNEKNTGPQISILMPVFNPLPEHLKLAIESVQNQIYVNWELCIADDCSTDPAVKALLANYEKADARIKVTYRKQNGHISAASNSALEMCSGEFVALMDQDDLIPMHALWLVKEAILQNPNAVLIYSDEDKIDEDGVRYDPYFKPAWNQYLIRSQNMFSHLGVYAKALMQRVGGFRLGFEGSQDYDLVLRCLDGLRDDEKIVHLPHVLYHWRVHRNSTARGGDAKPYAMNAGERALQEHLDRRGILGSVIVLEPGAYKIEYDISVPEPMLVIVVNHGLKVGRLEIASIQNLIKNTDYQNYEIWVGEDSLDSGIEPRFNGRVRVIPTSVGTFSCENYQKLVRESNLPEIHYLCFVSSTTPSNSRWLREMVGIMQNKEVGIVGGVLANKSGIINNAGYLLGNDHLFSPRLMGEKKTPISTVLTQELSAVSSGCMLVRSELFCEVGGFANENIRPSARDVGFCLGVSRLGYRIVWTPHSRLICSEAAKEITKNRVGEGKRTDDELKYFEQSVQSSLVKNKLVDGYLNPNCVPGYYRYRIDLDRPDRLF